MIVKILKNALKENASDVFARGGESAWIRVNGALVKASDETVPPAEIDLFRRSVLSADAEREFGRLRSHDAGYVLDGDRFRINFHMQDGRPALVARPVRSAAGLEFAALNLPPMLAEFADSPRGLILITGAAGSGKSTTMAAMISHINKTRARHIVCLEDPIEYKHQDGSSMITQREIGFDTPDFHEALRNAVRQSPDVLAIGEMRDLDTMQTALTAALTGRLVISTMHTSDTILAVERIINHFPEHLRQQVSIDLSMSLTAVVSQRLLPRKDGGGMIPAVEILKATPHVRNMLAKRNFHGLEDAIRSGREEGMKTFNRVMAEMCRDNVISLETGLANSSNKDEFLLLAKGMETGVDMFRSDLDQSRTQDEVDMKRLLYSAVVNNASDLILTVGSRPCVRFQGGVKELDSDPLTSHDTKRLLFSILSASQRAAFEETKETDFALTLNIKEARKPEFANSRFRINGFYQRGNIAVAVRVIPREIPPPETLGIPDAVMRMADKKQGLILVTGPTGHGKSTTLASLVDRINSTRRCHIITVEDPIEYVHQNKMSIVEQREVYADTLSFTNALKYVLRQNPDVILIGEMRDNETVAAALTAAETGHLVMATLHTNSAPQTIDRIIDSFPAHQQNQIKLQLSNCVLGIVAQRLIPRRDKTGRVAAFEVLVGNSGTRALIREGKTHQIQSVMETSFRDGMNTMEKALKELCANGLIEKDDVSNNIINEGPEFG